MPERSKFKKVLTAKIHDVNREIEKLDNYIETGKHVDYAVCYAKRNELQQRLQDLEELNQICVERNRY